MKKAKKAVRQSSGEDWSDVESRLIPVSEVSLEPKVAVYGRSGTGKTTFLRTCPKPVLILDVKEKGTTSIRKTPDGWVFPVMVWEDVERLYWYIMAKPGKFKTVAIDPISSLQDLAKQKIAGPDAGFLVSRKVWGGAADLMKTWIMFYRDLPMVVVFLAQDRLTAANDEEIGDDEDGITPEVGPNLMPSVAKVLNGAVDIEAQSFIRERVKKVKVKGGKTKDVPVTEYCFRIGPHARFTTKLRRDDTGQENIKVPGVMVDPTYDKLLALIK